MNSQRETEWAEAKKRCRLSDEAFAMARELGLNTRSLIKNIPNHSEPGKAQTENWVRSLYEKRFGKHRSGEQKKRQQQPIPAPAKPDVVSEPPRRTSSSETDSSSEPP